MHPSYSERQNFTLNPSETLSVTQLNQAVKQSLELHFNRVTVTGEIANYSRPLSGHMYFTLKDTFSELRCVLFRTQQSTDYIKLLKDGVAVEITGQVTLYAQRGQYQMTVSSLRLQGEGLLKQQFQALKIRLESLGLFDSSHKQPLPKYPRNIGVISSPGAAGLEDFLTILNMRYPVCHVRIFSSPVQGSHAAKNLIRALQQAQTDPSIDVIVFCRGGGSMEDMWCFNDEQLANAIYQCPTPIISAIGHEKDFTICDLCADVRAATPTNAAMIIAPDVKDINDQLLYITDQAISRMRSILQSKQLLHGQIHAKVRHPKVKIQNYLLALSKIHHQLITLIGKQLNQSIYALQSLSARLNKSILQTQLQQEKLNHQRFKERLHYALASYMQTQQTRLNSLTCRLPSLNPENILKRGYAVVKHADSIIHSKSQLRPNDHILLTFHDGSTTAIIAPGPTSSKDPKA